MSLLGFGPGCLKIFLLELSRGRKLSPLMLVMLGLPECLPVCSMDAVAADAHDAGPVRMHPAPGVEIATAGAHDAGLLPECMRLSVAETVAADAHDAGLVGFPGCVWCEDWRS